MKAMDFFKKFKRRSIEIPRNFFLFKVGVFLRYFRKPPLPQSGPILIHIGCGEFNDKRYINVDTRPGWHIHYVESIENFEKLFPRNYADLIYACHVLEHLSYLKVSQVLKGLFKCLKKGGILRLSVPDFDVILKIYQEKNCLEDILPPLMGGQGYLANFHFSVFTENYLKRLLIESGFREVRKWDASTASYHNFNDWSKRKINLYGKDWQISLNLEAVK